MTVLQGDMLGRMGVWGTEAHPWMHFELRLNNHDPGDNRVLDNLLVEGRHTGKTVQRERSGDLLFGPAAIVSFVSRYVTLLPGDVISTGTPAGVGLGMKPEPQYLKAGDIVELGLTDLGTQRQRIVDWRETA